jgi:hypothetical protein
VTHSDSSTRANILNEQFSSVFNKDEYIATIKNKGPSPFPSMGSFTVSSEGVKKLLDGLNIHKAAGPDGIPARVLKELSDELAPVLALFLPYQSRCLTGGMEGSQRHPPSSKREREISQKTTDLCH